MQNSPLCMAVTQFLINEASAHSGGYTYACSTQTNYAS